MLKSIIVCALLSTTSAKWWKDGKPTKDQIKDFNCGKCIKSGNNFCFQGSDGMKLNETIPEAVATCCEPDDPLCAAASDDNYSCSADYTNEDYSYSFCPQKRDKCGPTQQVTFDEEGISQNLTIFNMTVGDSCTYKIHSKCGAPVFRVDDF